MVSKKQFLENLLFLGSLLAFLWAIYFSLVAISIPYQLEFREGTAQVMTGLFLKGENPFTFDNQPLAMNNYGLGYSLVMLPFAALFGNTIMVHRFVTFLFVVLSTMFVFFVVYKKNGSRSLALTCAAFVMVGLVGRAGIGAFPSSQGTFFFLLAVLVPFLRSFDWKSLIISVLVSIAAFYTKPYFVLAFGIICSYLFLFVSKKKSGVYGFLFLILFFLSLVVVGRLYPLYFINTVVGNESNAAMTIEHLMLQLKKLFQSFYPVLFLSVFLFWARYFENRETESYKNKSFFNIKNLNLPLFTGVINFLAYFFLCCLLAFLLILGPHIGNFLNYAFQLLIPSFFCWFFVELYSLQKAKIIFVIVILFNLFVWELDVLNPTRLSQKDSKEWAQVYRYLHESSATLNSPAVASELVALGQQPVDSGQTMYFYAVQPFPENLLTGVDYDKFYADGVQYTRLVDRMIKKQYYDLVVITKEKGTFYHVKLLPDYYDKVDEIDLDMPLSEQSWTLIFWKPRR